MIAENIGIFYLSTVITEFLFFQKNTKKHGKQARISWNNVKSKIYVPFRFF